MITTLLERRTIAHETTELTLLVPVDEQETFSFKAGQYVNLTLLAPHYVDERGPSRDFSISSAPHTKQTITVAYRNSPSAWKRNVAEMTMGMEIETKGPFGYFTLPRKTERPLLFIAGGIGVVPFISIVRHLKAADAAHHATLFYANHSAEHAAYLDELLTSTHVPCHPHLGEVTKESLAPFVMPEQNPMIYIAGPIGMCAHAHSTLLSLGVDHMSILTEEFTGY